MAPNRNYAVQLTPHLLASEACNPNQAPVSVPPFLSNIRPVGVLKFTPVLALQIDYYLYALAGVVIARRKAVDGPTPLVGVLCL